MGRANASYLPAVIGHFGDQVASGSRAARFLRQEKPLDHEALAALRRYSVSAYPGQEDGKALNAALVAGNGLHGEWAEALDRTFAWTFTRDVILWRGFSTPFVPGEPSPCFVSASLVERQARKFRSRGGAGVAAILVPAGMPVTVPAFVWRDGDDERTLIVVRNEREVVLPRGTVLHAEGHVRPFGDAMRASVMLCRASGPEPELILKQRPQRGEEGPRPAAVVRPEPCEGVTGNSVTPL